MAQSEMSEEQVMQLQERVKNMSPQELKDFQKKQCIFCQIVMGKIAAKKIYEDDKVLGILDINPANPGHVLLLPKEHYSIMPQFPEDEIGQIFIVAKHLSNSMLRAIEAQGTNIIVANGIAAGQRAQHFMLHLIPRKENDGINFILPQKTLSQEQIEQVGDKLLAGLGGNVEREKEVKTAIMSPPKKEQEHHKTAHKETHSHPEKEHPKSEPHPEEKKQPHEKKEPKGSIDLDDIAKLLGAK